LHQWRCGCRKCDYYDYRDNLAEREPHEAGIGPFVTKALTSAEERKDPYSSTRFCPMFLVLDLICAGTRFWHTV
jgi:hypothetical protein